MKYSEDEFKTLGLSQAIVNKVTNTIDGGLRITLDVPAEDVDLASQLLQKAVFNDAIFVAFMVKK